MPSFEKYMAQYDHEHTNPWNKVMHGIGIPIILAGIVLSIFAWWRIGLALFLAGWILLFAGHRIEGNKPAFFQGVIYFLVGPIWIAKEIKDAPLRRLAPFDSAALTPTHYDGRPNARKMKGWGFWRLESDGTFVFREL